MTLLLPPRSELHVHADLGSAQSGPELDEVINLMHQPQSRAATAGVWATAAGERIADVAGVPTWQISSSAVAQMESLPRARV